MRSSLIVAALAGMAALMLAAAGCGLGPGQQAEELAGPGEVFIKDSSYRPLGVEVTADSTVTWVNKDTVQHTVSVDTPSPAASFDTTIEPGKSFKATFSQAGVYGYHCNIHGSMHGEVIVTGCSKNPKNVPTEHGAPPQDCK